MRVPQFPESLITKSVSIGPNKMSYVVIYGLGPYFTQLTLKEGTSLCTLQFNETLTAQVKKGMDLLVHYWSESHHEVKV